MSGTTIKRVKKNSPSQQSEDEGDFRILTESSSLCGFSLKCSLLKRFIYNQSCQSLLPGFLLEGLSLE